MAKYLDPKADLTFKKVFGEHRELVISFLNALLPLEEGNQVETIEYQPPELVPRLPESMYYFAGRYWLHPKGVGGGRDSVQMLTGMPRSSASFN